jgi:hypothetical protein
MVSGEKSGDIVIPKWFTYVMSGAAAMFMGIFIPWAAWISAAVITIQVKVDQAHALDSKIEAVNMALQKHTSDGELHFNALKRIESAERRLDRLEAKP